MKRIAFLLALLMALSCLTACGPKDQESDVTVLTEADEETTPAEDAAPAEEAPAEDAAPADEAAPAEETPAEDTAPAEETPAEDAAPADTAAAVPSVEIQQVENTVKAEDGTEILHTNYPVITVTGTPAAERLTQILDMEVSEYKGIMAHGISGESESLEAEAREGYEMSQTDGWSWEVPYADELTAQVFRCDEKVLCICFSSYTHTGGVHGFYYNYGRCYDSQTGERLMLKDLAAEGVDLQAWALDKVLEMTHDESMFEPEVFFEGYEDSLPDVVNDDFLLDENGLTFSAAPYELAAYAYGAIDFTIPYADLEGVVQSDYLK